MHVSLPGKYLVYMPFGDLVGVSKRIGDDGPQAVLHKGGGDPEDRFGAEPRGKDRRRDDRQRQASPGHRKIPGIVHTSGGIQPDADGDQQIEDDEPEDHARRIK